MTQLTRRIESFFPETGRMLPFNGGYLFPPRAETALPPSELPRFEGRYFAQPKLDGNCCLLFTNGSEARVMDRHRSSFSKVPKLLSDGTLAQLHRGDPGKWSLIVGEYMAKSKTDEQRRNSNDRYVIHDIVAIDGVHLTGTTFEQRIALLDDLYGTEESDQTELMSAGVAGVYRVRSHRTGFAELYERVTSAAQMYEGLVLKSVGGLLENGSTQKNTTACQAKVRRTTKNYKF